MITAAPNKAFDRVPLLPTILALAALVAMLGLARLNGVRPDVSLPTAAAIEQRVLRFEDAPQGHVIVRDASTGEEIEKFGRGEGVFVRATLRALVHDRIKKGITSTKNFRLEAHQGPQLFLIDEATGRAISLNAFGPTNTAVFAAFMSKTKLNKGESQ